MCKECYGGWIPEELKEEFIKDFAKRNYNFKEG